MNAIVTQESIARENLNREVFLIQTEEQFYSLYIQLIAKAVEFGLLNEMEGETINSKILSFITRKANEKLNTMGNIFYIISWYLMCFEWYEAFNKLKPIAFEQNAEEKFVNEAIDALAKQVSKEKVALKACEKKIYGFKSKIVIESFGMINNLLAYLENPITDDFKLGEKHMEYVYFGGYNLFGKSVFELNYISRLFTTIERFIKEISILQKMNVSGVYYDFQNAIKCDNEQYKTEIAKVEKKYDCKLSNIKTKFENLKSDDFKATQKLLEEKEKILQSKDEEISKLQKKFEYIEDFEYTIDKTDAMLEQIFKMFYIYKKCTEGKLIYPKTLKHRINLMSRISIKEACDVILENCEQFGLSEANCAYIREVRE